MTVLVLFSYLRTGCPTCSVIVQIVSLDSYKPDLFRKFASVPAFLFGFSEVIFAFIDETRLA